MKLAEHIEVKTAAGVRTAFLSPKADGLKGVYTDCRLNGESTFEFQLPANSPKISHLSPECQIWAGGRVYNLLKEDATDFIRDENNSLWAKFMAEERWNELDTQYPEPYITNDPLTPTPSSLTVIIVGGGSDLSGARYAVGSAGHALYAVLNGSGWTVGTVDVTGTHDLQMEKVSRLALVKEIQNTWGGYLVWDSVNKTVSLRNANTWQNYTGFQIRYKKNLKNITRTQSNRLITKLYVFGKDDLDISTVNGGLKHVVNNSYTANLYTGIYRNPDITDATELKNAAIAELSLICRPKYLYRGKIADLRTLPEYSHEDFTVGDMADVIDPDVAPTSPRPRIIRHKYNLFQPWDCELELGDPEERLIEKLKASFGTAGYIEDTLNSRGQLSGYKIVDGSIADVKIVSLTANKITAGIIDANIVTVNNLVVGTNVQIGTAKDAAGVTTIIGNTVTAGYVNALNVKAGSVDAENITGATITGKMLRTAASGKRVEISLSSYSGYINFTDSAGADRAWIYLNDLNTMQIRNGGDINILATNNIMLQSMSAGNISIYPAAGYECQIYGALRHGGSQLGFFNTLPVSQQTAALLGAKVTTEIAGSAYTSNEQLMLNNLKTDMQLVYAKIDGLITRFKSYGLFV